jgi:hypothetical protein
MSTRARKSVPHVLESWARKGGTRDDFELSTDIQAGRTKFTSRFFLGVRRMNLCTIKATVGNRS